MSRVSACSTSAIAASKAPLQISICSGGSSSSVISSQQSKDVCALAAGCAAFLRPVWASAAMRRARAAASSSTSPVPTLARFDPVGQHVLALGRIDRLEREMAEVDHVVVVVQEVAVVEIAGAQPSVEGRPLRLHRRARRGTRRAPRRCRRRAADRTSMPTRRRARPRATPIRSNAACPSRPPCDAPCRRVPSELWQDQRDDQGNCRWRPPDRRAAAAGPRRAGR